LAPAPAVRVLRSWSALQTTATFAGYSARSRAELVYNGRSLPYAMLRAVDDSGRVPKYCRIHSSSGFHPPAPLSKTRRSRTPDSGQAHSLQRQYEKRTTQRAAEKQSEASQKLGSIPLPGLPMRAVVHLLHLVGPRGFLTCGVETPTCALASTRSNADLARVAAADMDLRCRVASSDNRVPSCGYGYGALHTGGQP